MMPALFYFYFQPKARGEGRDDNAAEMMGYKMPFTASEDEQLQQLGPATVDEEACSALDHGGISSFILQLTCISTLTAAKRDSSYVWEYDQHTQ